MIKANELRVGNLVLKDGKPFRISGIEEGNRMDGLSGIAINPDVLQKCGFEYRSNRNSDGDEIEWMAHPTMYLIRYRNGVFSDGYSYTLPPFRHIHEIQNLFFTLTGEELKVQI